MDDMGDVAHFAKCATLDIRYEFQMIALGYILLVVGVILGIVGEVMFLVVAYKRSLLWFFGCLFVPIVCWIVLFALLSAVFAATWCSLRHDTVQVSVRFIGYTNASYGPHVGVVQISN